MRKLIALLVLPVMTGCACNQQMQTELAGIKAEIEKIKCEEQKGINRCQHADELVANLNLPPDVRAYYLPTGESCGFK